MEMHHRLRRDPSWHPNACNICGQLGHQAAQCMVGTVNWRQMYGENAFRMQRAVFQSDIDAAKKAKEINFDELERRAREYAKMREEAKSKSFENVAMPPQQFQQQPVANGTAAAAATAAGGDTEMADAAAATAAKPAAEKKPEEEGLPEGWAVAYDAQRRPYYWHKATKKVQWDKPTADAPPA